jgi:mono/diheme cytochrome c family protein
VLLLLLLLLLLLQQLRRHGHRILGSHCAPCHLRLA